MKLVHQVGGFAVSEGRDGIGQAGVGVWMGMRREVDLLKILEIRCFAEVDDGRFFQEIVGSGVQ